MKSSTPWLLGIVIGLQFLTNNCGIRTYGYLDIDIQERSATVYLEALQADGSPMESHDVV